MAEGVGQAEVVSWTKGQIQGFGGFGVSLGPFQGSFVLKCIGHNKQLVGQFNIYKI